VLEQARRGKVPPPRSLKKDVPRPLEAVCRKAMAHRPQERYATALLLAEDVEHWLADEPGSAYREPLPARLARGGRRHKSWVLAAAACWWRRSSAWPAGCGSSTANASKPRPSVTRRRWHERRRSRKSVAPTKRPTPPRPSTTSC